MPVPAEFGWSETPESIAFNIQLPSTRLQRSRVRGGVANTVDFIISPFYVRLSSQPYFFEADLFDEIDTEASTFRFVSATGEGHFQLKKKLPSLWQQYSATQNPKLNTEGIRSRRLESLEAYENKQKERRERHKSIRYQRQRTSQEEQWRIERDAKAWLEHKKEEEKQSAIQSLFGSDEDRKTATAHGECETESGMHHSPTEDLSLSSKYADERDSRDTTQSDEAEECVGIPCRRPQDECTIHELAQRDRRHDSSGQELQQDSPTPAVHEGSNTGYDILPTSRSEKIATIPPANTKIEEISPFVPHLEDVTCSSALAMRQQATTDPDTPPTEAGTPQRSKVSGECDKSSLFATGSKKVVLNFTARKHHRLPARGDKVPPFPRNVAQVSSAKGAKDAGASLSHEKDQQWLKDKGTRLLQNGDLSGATEAYTEALNVATEDTDCLANRSYAFLMLGNLDRCIEDCQRALGIIKEKETVPEGHLPPPPSSHTSRVRDILYNRLAVCFTWKGCFDQADRYFSKATLDVEGDRNTEELKRIREDALRLKGLRELLDMKLSADYLLRGIFESEVPCGEGKGGSDVLPYGDATLEEGAEKLIEAKKLYGDIVERVKPIKQYTFLVALCLSNRALASFWQAQYEESLEDSNEALRSLQISDIVAEKSLRSTPEGSCWRRAPVLSTGDLPDAKSKEEEAASGRVQETCRAVVTKANERPFKNLLIKARLRRVSALEQLGRYDEALHDALETLRLDPFNVTAKCIARKATKKLEEQDIPSCTPQQLNNSCEASTAPLSLEAHSNACPPQPGESESMTLRVETENIDALLQAASAHLRKNEISDALDLYQYAARAGRKALLTAGGKYDDMVKGCQKEVEEQRTKAESRSEEVAEGNQDISTLECRGDNEEAGRTPAVHESSENAEEEQLECQRLKRWLCFHRCRALANATFCLHLLNESQKVVDVATEALYEVELLKSSLKSVDKNNEEPKYNELLRIECSCLSRRGLAFRDLQRVEESADDQRSVQGLLKKLEQCCE